MALTNSQKPQDYTPAYNAQFITYLSDQVSQPGFKYIIEISVNGDTALVQDIAKRPDNYMVYDAQEWVKNYIERNFNPTNLDVLEAVNKAVEVEVTVSEYYSGMIQATDTFEYIAFDLCLTDRDFRNYSIDNYAVNGTSVVVAKYKDPDERITLNTDVWLHFFRNASDVIHFEVLDASNVSVGTFDLTIPSTNELIYYVNIGAKTLIDNSITPGVGYTVNIEFEDTDLSATTYVTSYVFTYMCTLYDIYTVYYLKRNGAIGFMHFELFSEKSESKKTNTVKLDKNQLVSGVYGSNEYDREQHVISTELTEKIVLNSNWITEDQSTQLKELFNSPIVWIKDVDTDQTYIPISITDTSYIEKKNVTDPLFNYIITADLPTETRQRGL